MKKYCISGSNAYNDIIGGGATAKAPADVARAAKEYGYDLLFLKGRNGGKIKSYIYTFFELYKLFKSIKKGDSVLIQYPQYQLLFLNLILCKKFAKTSFLIHDINSVRVKGKLSKIERICLNCADEIIVHSQQMENYLKPLLKKSISYKKLGCFDYYVNINQENFNRDNSKEICFAGNIDKSVFLHKFLKLDDQNISFHLYGLMKREISNNANASYEGAFKPDNIDGLKGSWGLVWDGSEIGSCKGYYGEYLSIIAPHKFSLYIVAGLPPIVWSKSAMADVVREKKLGLCIDSLLEIDKAISNTTPEEYNMYIKNLLEYSRAISKGANTKNALMI